MAENETAASTLVSRYSMAPHFLLCIERRSKLFCFHAQAEHVKDDDGGGIVLCLTYGRDGVGRCRMIVLEASRVRLNELSL